MSGRGAPSLHSFIMREAASTGQIKRELTKAQYYTLYFLETRDRTHPGDPNLRHRVGMLRVMEARGLVSRNIHGFWSITAKGRLAVANEAQARH